MTGHDPTLPLVTIVTPSYNQGRFIRETIESVLNQDYPNIEYIIIDNASTDNTADVIKPYLSRLTYISEPDDGQSHAINKGFALARGSIVAWLNSDDVFLPGAVSNAVAAFIAHPEAAVTYGEGFQIDVDSNVKQRFPFTQHFDRWKLVHLSDYILQQTVFFRKAALDAVGPLREDLDWVMDWEILIRLAKKYEFVQLPEYLGSLREHEAAKTAQGGIVRATEIRRMLAEHCRMPFPPGYQVYGFVTYEQVWTKAIEAWPKWLEPLGTFLCKAIRKVLFKLVNRAMVHGQRWYRDLWMAPSALVMLSEGSGEAVIHGQVPGNIPGLEKQRVRVLDRGRVLADEEFGHGKFELRFTVPERPEGTSPILDIESSESFVLAKIGLSSDKRTLSFKMFDIGWSHPKTFSLPVTLAESA